MDNKEVLEIDKTGQSDEIVGISKNNADPAKETRKAFKKVTSTLKSFIFPKAKKNDLTGTQRSAIEGLEKGFKTNSYEYENMTNHDTLYNLLPWREVEGGYVMMDDGKRLQLGFGMQFFPFMVAVADVEDQIESIISRCPDDTVIQFAAHSTRNIKDRLKNWAFSRTVNNKNELLQELVQRRVSHFHDCAYDYSLVPNQRMHPREVYYYCFFKMTYNGDMDSVDDVVSWKKGIDEIRQSILGTFQSMQVSPILLNDADLISLLRRLLNPQVDPDNLHKTSGHAEGYVNKDLRRTLVEKGTRMLVDSGTGDLMFTGGDKDIQATNITIDSYPEHLHLFMTGELTGALESPSDRIAPEYWLYTNIYKPNPDKARDDLSVKLGMISKQTMSDSEWFKSMVPHIFKRRSSCLHLLDQTRGKYGITKMYTGLVVYNKPHRASADTDFITAIWRKAGFRGSKEKFISLPVWMNSLPFCYRPDHDNSVSGLQRGITASSYNASCAAVCQGDWRGNADSGILLTSRKGQMACIDIFQSNTSYNFVVIATSGAGKSFLANEIVSDVLSRNGMVRIVDVGRSYADLSEILGGQNLVFDPNRPLSLNPFWGFKKVSRFEDDEGGNEFAEMVPILKDVLIQMAFPLGDPPNFHYQFIERAILDCFDRYEDKLETKHIYDWLLEYDDDRAVDMAKQLEPYAVGRYATWFNGERKLEFKNAFVILELEELNVDRQLRSVVLTLLISSIARDMYLSDRGIPKIMLVDEAWDLLGDSKAGKFIETAFRRIRKYYGAAGIITQSFKDTDISPAAAAAFDNAPWKFVLKQSGPSLADAKEKGKLGTKDEWFFKLLNGIKPGLGYSELYVQHEMGTGVFRFMVDDFTYFLYSTNPKDIKAINDLKATGLTTKQAIESLAESKRLSREKI